MRLGIGSFAYRYAVGVSGFAPQEPMKLETFAGKAKKLGYQGIQICENFRYAEKGAEELKQAAEYISRQNLTVELGMNGIFGGTVERHLDLCHIFGSSLLRAVIGHGDMEQEVLYRKAFKTIQNIMPRLERERIVLGIENHFDLTSDNIVRLIREFDSPWVRAIYDTTNSIGFIEPPDETLEKLLPYCVSVHIKDYEIQKAEAGYQMAGMILGTGQLDVYGIVSKLKGFPDIQSAVLEMTIRRRAGADVGQVLREEEEQVRESTRYFIQAFGVNDID